LFPGASEKMDGEAQGEGRVKGTGKEGGILKKMAISMARKKKSGGEETVKEGVERRLLLQKALPHEVQRKIQLKPGDPNLSNEKDAKRGYAKKDGRGGISGDTLEAMQDRGSIGKGILQRNYNLGTEKGEGDPLKGLVKEAEWLKSFVGEGEGSKGASLGWILHHSVNKEWDKRRGRISLEKNQEGGKGFSRIFLPDSERENHL